MGYSSNLLPRPLGEHPKYFDKMRQQILAHLFCDWYRGVCWTVLLRLKSPFSNWISKQICLKRKNRFETFVRIYTTLGWTYMCSAWFLVELTECLERAKSGRKWYQLISLPLKMCQQGHLKLFLRVPSCN